MSASLIETYSVSGVFISDLDIVSLSKMEDFLLHSNKQQISAPFPKHSRVLKPALG